MTKRGLTVFSLVAALAAAGCASENWQDKYESSQKTLLDTTTELTDAKQQRAEQAAKAEQYAAQLTQSDKEVQKARQLAEAKAKEAEDARQQAATAMAGKHSGGASAGAPLDNRALAETAQALERDGPKGTKASVTKEGNIEITLPSDVSFGVGSCDLTETGKKNLKAIVPFLKGKFAPYQIRVEGHTDSTPVTHHKEYKDNFGLGSARALAVVRFMEKDLGIESTRLMSASRGEHDPVADNKSDTGKKQNRRVEIVVIVPHDAAMSQAK